MDTFSFFIPLAVISAMALCHDGQTVSREVRVSDLLADGAISVSEYHALASAGVVVVPLPLFTFESVEETAQGWVCIAREPDPLAWGHTRDFIREVFPSSSSSPSPANLSSSSAPSAASSPLLREIRTLAEETEAILREIEELIEIYRPR